MRVRAGLVACCLAALLAGCGAMMRAPGAGGSEAWLRPGAPQPRSEADSLLLYFEFVRRLAAGELAREYEAARHLYAASRTDFNRVRFAIVASVPGGSNSDDARALEALGPLLKTPDAGLHGVAYMVSTQIQDQRRAQSALEKLDALKLLEKQMIERDPATSTRRP